jgi:hypothetical protein
MIERPTRYAVNNKRMVQAMRHAGVRASATSPSMVILRWADNTDRPDGEDPLHALIRHLEPSAVRGHEHMPSLEEAIAAGLIGEDQE